MPHEEFSADVGVGKMGLMHMDGLRSRYVASVEATLKRMLDFTDHPCAAVF